MGAPVSHAVLNSLYCKRMAGNFFGFKGLATAQWNLNDLKIHRFRLRSYYAEEQEYYLHSVIKKSTFFSKCMHFAHIVDYVCYVLSQFQRGYRDYIFGIAPVW